VFFFADQRDKGSIFETHNTETGLLGHDYL